ncbi:hypothetical protein F4820DRAFT_401640 [Hypoxylon rubiginosum]|uniref:Uncharacterized protein n=1 Tax=Hypoxylon rubiginosum TaxID=110542 RepID=A0ACB9ZHU0_9PEZI|nr:hypothetical protein F4820DRAFT_401640 [Hypoxylon rubiginosum]
MPEKKHGCLGAILARLFVCVHTVRISVRSVCLPSEACSCRAVHRRAFSRSRFQYYRAPKARGYFTLRRFPFSSTNRNYPCSRKDLRQTPRPLASNLRT